MMDRVTDCPECGHVPCGCICDAMADLRAERDIARTNGYRAGIELAAQVAKDRTGIFTHLKGDAKHHRVVEAATISALIGALLPAATADADKPRILNTHADAMLTIEKARADCAKGKHWFTPGYDKCAWSWCDAEARKFTGGGTRNCSPALGTKMAFTDVWTCRQCNRTFYGGEATCEHLQAKFVDKEPKR